MQLLDIGEPIPVRTNWWDEAGAPTNPTAIALTITKPNGVVLNKTKADMTQGPTVDVWIYEPIADVEGAWLVRAVATIGADTVVQESSVLVGAGEHVGPCEPWCTWEDVERCGSVTVTDEIAKQLWLEQATEILYALSDQHYPGICTVTRSLCWGCFACYPSICTCDPYPGIDLGGRYPVWGVYDVTIDGVSLPPSAYIVRSKRWLVRTDGPGWPSGWHTADPNAWRATWATGRPRPTAGRLAAARFTLEIAKRCVGDKTCTLPSRVTTVVREGVTYTILDSMKLIAEGRTGLDLVDLWLAADRIGRKPKPGIYHPALHGTRRL